MKDSTGQATVDKSYHWKRIDHSTPRGTKLQLINEGSGIAYYGQITKEPWATHWSPVPTFEKRHGKE